jgi:alpha-tubulin suppressor-like RCC1 family protein
VLRIIKPDGTTWAAGINNFGQLGNGTTISSNVFVADVTGATDVDRIGQGTDVLSVWASSSGEMRVCGYNLQGQLGDGTTTSRSTAVVPVFPGQNNISQVAVNTIEAIGGCVYVLCNDGTVYSAGSDLQGAVGQGTVSTQNYTTFQQMHFPVRVNQIVASAVASPQSLYAHFHTNDGLWAVGSGDATGLDYDNMPVPQKVAII